ncbi:MAG: glycosyltransferase [Bacteroides sp.]|nr:glycosyltransferase [Bacteroides sp.]
MRMLFLVFQDLKESHGISKKIIYQYEAFRNWGMDIDLCSLNPDETGRRNYVVRDRILGSIGRGPLSRLRFFADYRGIYNFIREQEIKVIYIRYTHFANPFFLSFLKKLKKRGVRIFVEIPTYPYDGELKTSTFLSRMKKRVEYISRNQFYRYVDRIVTFSDDKIIFGTPTVKISNGVDFSKIPIKRSFEEKGTFNLLGVASMAAWHGFDRVIDGLHAYYSKGGKESVHFYIVGGGKQEIIDMYKRKIAAYDLSEYVHLMGPASGNTLDEYFDKAHLAIGAIGGHRKNLFQAKSLKNVEYAARGIPFVYSMKNEDFDQQPYIKKVSMDDSAVSIEELMAFYRSATWSSAEIRKSVEPRLSWYHQMGIVLKELPGVVE